MEEAARAKSEKAVETPHRATPAHQSNFKSEEWRRFVSAFAPPCDSENCARHSQCVAALSGGTTLSNGDAFSAGAPDMDCRIGNPGWPALSSSALHWSVP